MLDYLPGLDSDWASEIRARLLEAVLDVAIQPPPGRTSRAHRPEELDWGAACRTMACLAVGRILRGQTSSEAWIAAEPYAAELAEAWRWVAICKPRSLPPAVEALLGL